MSEINKTTWFSTLRGLVGIVECYDGITNETKYYIGIGNGIDEDADAEYIKNNGAKFIPDLIK